MGGRAPANCERSVSHRAREVWVRLHCAVAAQIRWSDKRDALSVRASVDDSRQQFEESGLAAAGDETVLRLMGSQQDGRGQIAQAEDGDFELEEYAADAASVTKEAEQSAVEAARHEPADPFAAGEEVAATSDIKTDVGWVLLAGTAGEVERDYAKAVAAQSKLLKFR